MSDDDDADTDTTGPGGSGRGGDLGTPTGLPKMEPPSADQENNEVVSGGGLIGPEDDEPSGNDGEPTHAAGS